MEALEAARSVGEGERLTKAGRTAWQSGLVVVAIEIAKHAPGGAARRSTSVAAGGRWVLETRLKHLSEVPTRSSRASLNLRADMGPLVAALALPAQEGTVFRRLAAPVGDALLADSRREPPHTLSLRPELQGQPESRRASSATTPSMLTGPFFLAHPAAFARDTALFLDNLLQLLEDPSASPLPRASRTACGRRRTPRPLSAVLRTSGTASALDRAGATALCGAAGCARGKRSPRALPCGSPGSRASTGSGAGRATARWGGARHAFAREDRSRGSRTASSAPSST